MAFYKGAAKEAQRATILKKQRETEKAATEEKKRRLEAEMSVGDINNKFTVHYDAVEQRLKSDTVGLVTLEQMRARQEAVISAREKQLASRTNKAKLTEIQQRAERKAIQKRGTLSFNFNDDDDDDHDDETQEEEEKVKQEVVDQEDVDHDHEAAGTESTVVEKCEAEEDDDQSAGKNLEGQEEVEEVVTKKRRRLGKNPDVDTSFLPDIDREEEENRLREELRREWVSKQEAIKEEEIEITYSYWDGSGHRRQVRMKKGHSMSQFLHRCLEQLRKEFPELRSTSHDQMMYVKEDLIIPHHYTFYDFIVTKARGKSGPLFVFDARDDVRLMHDAGLEKEESHAGKVCLRSWYERHKHIFPASRWEPYDPTKNWDQYTVSDKMAVKITVK